MHDFDLAAGSPRALLKRPARPASRRANLLLAASSVLLSLAALEIGLRVVMDVPVFDLSNWRKREVVVHPMGDRMEVDPVLGWTMKANHTSEEEDGRHNTLDHGIRLNFVETTLRTGATLAVGNSFTEGWEVVDDESWPAYLEKITGTPVLNAGVGGYATDQIILRAEQLLPIVRPKTLIVGIFEHDITRSGHSHFGAPKPYFTIENGALKYHAPARIEPRREPDLVTTVGYGIRDVLGYSAMANYLFGSYAANYWYGSDRLQFRQVETDPVRVTCALLERLKKQTDRDGVKLLVFMQHPAAIILQEDEPTEIAQNVVDCADAAGIRVVDQFQPLRAIAKGNPEEFWTYYLQNSPYGEESTHMSGKGNEHAAMLLAAELAK